jgi:argininosuccinate synthase
VPWLKNTYKCEVIAFCANLGQADELVGLEEKALASGASKVYIEDLRLEFLTDYVFPTMQAARSTSAITCSAPPLRAR